jgi:hypothetical protein
MSSSTALSRNPAKIDLLQSTKFRLTFDRLPSMTWFCQSVNFPGVSLTEIARQTPFVDLYSPGEKLVYDTLNVSFLVDEDMQAWFQVHDWIRALTFPTNFGEYINLSRVSQSQNIKATTKAVGTQFSDATVTLYSNKNNPKIRINIVDAFPTSLSSINLSAQDTADNIITADATFRFSYYEYERIS